jgi:predicted CXXCH cytochrome family protein
MNLPLSAISQLLRLCLAAAILILFPANPARAQEKPHDLSCWDCHTSHAGFGDQFDSLDGNANVCLACHQHGGSASAKALNESDQAQPWAGVATNTVPRGSSHRWDAASAGQVISLGAAPAYAVSPVGTYTGRYAATYTVTIVTAGSVGAARFDWTKTAPGAASGTNVMTSHGAQLDQGLVLDFVNFRPDPAFRPGDSWQIRVRPDLNPPVSPELTWAMSWGKAVCSTCHDQHSQEKEPFDPAAPEYVYGASTGRHFMRVNNAQDQVCGACHGARMVNQATAGSHPVGVLVASNANYHPPATLPLDKDGSRMWCSTCHQVHQSPADDGNLLRVARETELCGQCHAAMDTQTPASHLNLVSGPLWPGGQYGSQFPAEADRTHRGACGNCHRVHGWPDPSSATNDYPNLLVEREENLCYTCHDGSPATKNLRANFTKTYKHPVALAGRHTTTEDGIPARYGTANRHSECADCHNVHQLTPDPVPPVAPYASTALQNVARVSVNNLSTNSIAYTFRSASDPAPVKEFELCFLCHSGWTTQPAGQTNYAAKFNDKNPSFHPVEAVGKNLNINPVAFTNGWTETSLTFCTDCHTSDDTTIRGPHGSANQWILKRPYSRSTTPALASNGLCFECHSYAVYGANAQGSRFRDVDRSGHNHGGYNCYACHESHGSSTKPFLLGNSVTTYTKTATGGTCDPSCHGSESYTVRYPR